MNALTLRLVVALGWVAALGAAPTSRAAAQQAEAGRSVRIIVNAENPTTTLAEAEVARLFLRKTSTWQATGWPVLPIEQVKGSLVRAAFARQILKKDDTELDRYWQVMVFTGKGSPPPTRASDEDVIAVVRHSPYAIAYVSASASLPAEIRTITITP